MWTTGFCTFLFEGNFLVIHLNFFEWLNTTIVLVFVKPCGFGRRSNRFRTQFHGDSEDPNLWIACITAGRAAILPSLKEPPQLQFKVGLPFFRGLVLDRLNLPLSRPFLPPPPPLPLYEPMADRGKVPPRNSSRYLSISAGDEGKKHTSVILCHFYFPAGRSRLEQQLVKHVNGSSSSSVSPTHTHTVSRQRAAQENSLVDQDAEGGFHHSLLSGTQPTVARRRSLRRRRREGGGGGGQGGGGGGALGCYPGDDGFFHTGDDHGVPEPGQPPEHTHTHTQPPFFIFFSQTVNFSPAALTFQLTLK